MVKATQEKRKQKGTYIKSLIMVTFSILGKTEKHIGLVDNISCEGIGFISDTYIPPGILLEILLNKSEDEDYWRWGEENCQREVLWCTRFE